MTVNEIVTALASRVDVDTRVRVLTEMVLDLFVEVEALRGAIHSSVEHERDYPDQSVTAGKSQYQKSYLSAVYTSHNAAGPSSGTQKILEGFYPERDVRELRECSVLRRLGFTEDEVARYLEAAHEAELFT